MVDYPPNIICIKKQNMNDRLFKILKKVYFKKKYIKDEKAISVKLIAEISLIVIQRQFIMQQIT